MQSKAPCNKSYLCEAYNSCLHCQRVVNSSLWSFIWFLVFVPLFFFLSGVFSSSSAVYLCSKHITPVTWPPVTSYSASRGTHWPERHSPFVLSRASCRPRFLPGFRTQWLLVAVTSNTNQPSSAAQITRESSRNRSDSLERTQKTIKDGT